MRQLYHQPISPSCRAIRILLHEKNLDFELRNEKIWERRDSFLRLNPAGEVPVLIDADGTTISGVRVIVEYLEEAYPEPSLLGNSPVDRAEVRRLFDWFDQKFQREVTVHLVEEKVMKRYFGSQTPDASAIRAGLKNIHMHLDYIAWLSDRRRWLAGDYLSLADIIAASHISAIDYLGDILWDDHPGAKDWYQRFKSRPSMRAILGDYVSGLKPAEHYTNLDF
ncbi:MAG: glutathione S-transferase family protein [Kiloniellales bacterium]|nr:glutathione S-transferase family protein [Kiloniellales bacterium]